MDKRYSRHTLLEGFGQEGQAALQAARVLIIGAGGLGSPCALYLAAAGIGTIGIMDGDDVSLSNLQRQIAHFSADCGRPKVESIADKMQAINPEISVLAHHEWLTEENAERVLQQYDFILDCTDSFRIKYLVNDVCIRLGKPLCTAGIVGYSGQVMTILPGTAGLRTFLPEPPADFQQTTCADVGVLGPAVGVLGSIQACECIKYLVSTRQQDNEATRQQGNRLGNLLTNRLLIFDALTMTFQHLAL